MNKVPLLAFSILLLVPVGAQNAIAGPPSPDLTITNVQINPPSPTQFVEATFTVTIENIGSADAFSLVPPIEIIMFAQGGTSIQNIVSLNAGDSIQLIFPRTLAFDGATLATFTVDALDIIAESDESNNVFEINFNVLTDSDFDSIPDGIDNCPNTPNTDQANADNDELGDVCDPTPNGESSIIGGKIILIETTSLLLAGAQSFSWMIPVLLAGIGIGLFVFRKSENP